ncbi:hypothetical protein C8Q80DRAFT_1170490 [Daedaleopsis nitida]|nr:hypothetical protein C8Q80DRAFT_1170490 [Daedaleopsis nitida]
MSAAGPSEHDYVQHGKEPSGGSHLNIARSNTPLSQRGADGGDGYYDDDEDVFEEYMHERLPSQPAKLDIELPESNLDLTMTFESILEESKKQNPEEMDRVQKRQSNVMKLAEQNEKLKEELRAMTERLEAAERRQKDLESRAQRRSAEGAH